jgi:hypothetical protein
MLCAMVQPPRGEFSPLLLALVVAVAIGLGVGIGALLFGSDDNGSGSTGNAAGTKPISLPSTLGGFRDAIDVSAGKAGGAAQVTKQRAHQSKVRSTTEAAYTKAFGGAPAAYRAYADSDLNHLPYVIAVRAEAPGLTLGPVTDAQYLGLAAPDREVKTVGEVSCQILWSPTQIAGKPVDPSAMNVLNCQRSGSGVTVFTGGGSFSGPADLQSLVDLTNAAWSAASGS